MKQRSLFRKYFFACTGLILLTIAFLGVVFLSFASQYFQNDRFSSLYQNAVYALEAPEKLCVNVNGTYKVSSSLDDVYIPIAKAIDADFDCHSAHSFLCIPWFIIFTLVSKDTDTFTGYDNTKKSTIQVTESMKNWFNCKLFYVSKSQFCAFFNRRLPRVKYHVESVVLLSKK